MNNRRALFVGPSAREANTFYGWDIQPPAKAGDLINYVMQNSSVEILVVVDGYFFEEFAILHREIKEVIESGYVVIGCSSMGALRAVEMKSYGMIGFGEVYNYYIHSPRTGDDEVGLIHEVKEGCYRHLTIPLINLRILAGKIHDRVLGNYLTLLVDYLSTLSFGDRDWKCVEEYIDRIAGSESQEILRLLKDQYVDYKAIDLERTIREAESLVLPQRGSEDITQIEIDRALESIKSGKSAIDDLVLAPYVRLDTRDSEIDDLVLSTQSLRDLTVLNADLHSDLVKEQLYRQLLLAEGIRNDINVYSSDLNRFVVDMVQRRGWGSLSRAYQETYLVRSTFTRFAVSEYIVHVTQDLMLSSQGNNFALSSYLDTIRTISSIDEVAKKRAVMDLAKLIHRSLSDLGVSITRKVIKQIVLDRRSKVNNVGSRLVGNVTRTDIEEILDRWTKTCRE